MQISLIISLVLAAVAAKSTSMTPHPLRNLVRRDVVSDAQGCSLDTKMRPIGHPVSQCPDDMEKDGLLCYPPCAQNYTGIGPVCWNGGKSYGRGVGKPLGCAKNEEYQAGLCYEACPQGYTGIAMACFQNCPKEKPFRCGLICTDGLDKCNDQKMAISSSGFNVLYGIGTMGASVASVLGSGGMLSVAGVFGLFGGFSELGTGIISIINQLLTYPFCDGTERKNEQIARLQKARLQYHETFAETCKRLLTTEDVVVGNRKKQAQTTPTPTP